MSNNTLKHFNTVDDLFDTVDNEVILAWVNDLHDRKTAQSKQGKKYRLKQHALAKLAEQFLERDEIQRVKEQVEVEVENE